MSNIEILPSDVPSLINGRSPDTGKTAETSRPESKILKVHELLSKPGLTIPSYQRPYKWTSQHVHALFSDIARHKDKSVYRLGTIVFHQYDRADLVGCADLVDGQQRTITLLLAALAIVEKVREKFKDSDLVANLDALAPHLERLSKLTFASDISRRNIHQNYLIITRLVSRSDFTEELIDFLLNRCEVVTFTLSNLSEAFQFFDSQNARGRDLDPHDLLKAYHLREFSPNEEASMTRTIEQWESLDSNKLARFFENYWFRIRRWSGGHSARYFGKDDVGLFKGINLSDEKRYPFAQALRIAHFFTDHHNRQYERHIDWQSSGFPFQWDQVILNGRRFFEMTSHYLNLTARITSDPDLRSEAEASQSRFPEHLLDGYAKDILIEIDLYTGRHRAGDKYVRTLFDCLLLFYLDRFGHVEVSRAIEKSFIWAYSLRLKRQRIQLASADKHALSDPVLFRILHQATSPDDFLHVPLETIKKIEFENGLGEIPSLFRKMKYLDDGNE